MFSVCSQASAKISPRKARLANVMPPALDRSLHSSLHPLLAIIIHTLDYYDIRARRHRYRSGKLTCLEEEHIISTICHSSQFLPEVAETEVIRRWAQAVTTTIWEKAYLTETAKKQISDKDENRSIQARSSASELHLDQSSE